MRGLQLIGQQCLNLIWATHKGYRQNSHPILQGSLKLIYQFCMTELIYFARQALNIN